MRPHHLLRRAALAALLAWMAWIHLHLWDRGYRHLHVVGPLFLGASVAAGVVAAMVLSVPSRLLALPASAGVLLAGWALLGLAVSVNLGLFGFRDSLAAPFAGLSILVEGLIVAVGVPVTLAAGKPALSRPTKWRTRCARPPQAR